MGFDLESVVANEGACSHKEFAPKSLVCAHGWWCCGFVSGGSDSVVCGGDMVA